MTLQAKLLRIQNVSYFMNMYIVAFTASLACHGPNSASFVPDARVKAAFSWADLGLWSNLHKTSAGL